MGRSAATVGLPFYLVLANPCQVSTKLCKRWTLCGSYETLCRVLVLCHHLKGLPINHDNLSG